MGMQDVITTLHEFLKRWLTDAGFRREYDGDVDAALKDHGFDDVDSETLLECLPLVAEDLPLIYQRSVYEYIDPGEVNNGSDFSIKQSGGDIDASGDGGYGGGDSGHDGSSDVAKHIYKIQNITENNSYIDDRDVNTTINALGDVDFDQVVANGDGAVAAGEDIKGVNTGTNNGVIAGDDADGAKVSNTSVTGHGNTLTGDVAAGAVVVSGDDNVLAKDSNVIDGDFSGGNFVGGDAENSNLVDGKQYNVHADDSAVNFGSGKNVNDQSTDVDVEIDDSFNTDKSTNIDDSFQDNDKVDDKDLVDDKDIKDDKDVVDVDDSFQDNDKVDDKDLVDYDDQDLVDYDDQDLVDYDDQDLVDVDDQDFKDDKDVVDHDDQDLVDVDDSFDSEPPVEVVG